MGPEQQGAALAAHARRPYPARRGSQLSMLSPGRGSRAGPSCSYCSCRQPSRARKRLRAEGLCCRHPWGGARSAQLGTAESLVASKGLGWAGPGGKGSDGEDKLRQGEARWPERRQGWTPGSGHLHRGLNPGPCRRPSGSARWRVHTDPGNRILPTGEGGIRKPTRAFAGWTRAAPHSRKRGKGINKRIHGSCRA